MSSVRANTESSPAGGDPLHEASGCRQPCVICGGTGTVNGRNYADPLWNYQDYINPFMECPSCRGSGLANDMQYC